jgi:hypothetical protein
MPNDNKACPHCGVAIPVVAMRKDRPFSCPNCQRLVSPNSAYLKYGTAGCFSFLALFIAVAAFVGLRGSHFILIASLVVGAIVGIFAGILAANGIVWGLQKLFPRAPKMGKYALRDHPKLVAGTADFLDSVRELPEWSWKEDRGLDSFWGRRSLDDALENEALMAAQEFKTRLTNSSEKVKHVSDEIRKLSLNELREELAAIAIDHRIAVK